ncbi:MAG: fibrobacter succinogenes major paralogous domain-containing protein [Bacteroidota bacterium]|jgi:uncharacterized protein (TIGR02145 family)
MKYYILELSLFALALLFSSCNNDTTNPTQNNSTTIILGTQVWTVKNLDVVRYRNGDIIPEVRDSAQWINLTTGAWCYYNNDSTLGAVYGRLYNWYAVTDPRGLAPEGWHIPTDGEWTTLTNNLGGETVAGGKLKEKGTVHWLSPNIVVPNESGFKALPGGWRNYNGTFEIIGTCSGWWSSSEFSSAHAWTCLLYYNNSIAYRFSNLKEAGYSVRCIKD